jgi:tetratricopeptide (TPR) repeat protein
MATDMDAADRFDVFLSHAWGDHLSPERVADRPQRAGVEQLRDALRQRGLRVFYDEGSIDEFAPLADTIIDGLKASKVFVAWCSDLYLSRPACASELTNAMTWSVGDDDERVLVVNTEATVDHMPTPLRANLIPSAPEPDDVAGLGELADAIAERCAALTGGLGDGVGASPLSWYPEKIPSSTRFTGRFRELWDLHGILTSSALQSAKDTRRGAVVSGMGGSGKSLLALEYAHRFGAAWPGGVVFLTGHGFDRDISDDLASSTDHALSSLRAMAATDLDIKGVADMNLEALRAAIQRWFAGRGPVLWIVDDLADDTDTSAWTAPMEDAATILTTRVRTYDGLFEPLHLDELSAGDAVQLLTRDHPPTAPDQHAAATTITERLGRNALALDVTRCRIRSGDDYVHLLTRLHEDTLATLERAGNNVGDLAVDHTASIIATLRSSIDDLTPHGNRVLEIGACFDSLPLPDITLMGIVHALDGGDLGRAEDDTIDGLADLERHSLAKCNGATTTIHRLVVDLARPAGERDRTLAAADSVLSGELDDVTDERALRSRRAHHELAATLPVNPYSQLSMWMARYEAAVGNTREAILRLEHLLELRDRLLGSDDPASLATRHELALAHVEAGHHERAVALHESTLADRERILGSDDPATLSSRHGLGVARFWGQFEARDLLESTLADRERILGLDHPDTLATRHYLARACSDDEDVEQAIALFESTVADRERILGSDHLDTLETRAFLALAYQYDGDLPRAIALLEELLSVMESVFGPEHRGTLATRTLVGDAYRADGEVGRAIDFLASTATDTERTLGSEHPFTLQAFDLLADAHLEAGNFTEAIAALEATEQARNVDPGHPSTILWRHTLARAHQSAGDLPSAIAHFESVVDAAEAFFGTEHPNTRECRSDLADAYRENGDHLASLKLRLGR